MKNAGKKSRKFFKNTVKKHRWYDYSFIYTFLIKILEYMEKNWHKSHYLNSEKDLNNIKLAKSYLIQLRDDDFLDKYIDPIDKKYGSLGINNHTINRPKRVPNEILRKAYSDAHRDKTRIKRKLYLLLYKELENWWD